MNAEVEDLTRRIGQDLFARVAMARPVRFGATWWDDRLMDLTMSNEAAKPQLFRFVDVLPQLDTPAAIVGHLREYFLEAREHLPPEIRLLLRLLPRRGVLAKMLAAVVRWSTRRLARKFIAGSNI